MARSRARAVPLLAAAFVIAIASRGVFCADLPAKVYSMKLGNFDVTSVQEAQMDMTASLFVNADPQALKEHMPEGKLPVSINLFVVKTGKKTILVDAGSGSDGSDPGKTAKLLKSAGVKPKDIDIILMTHLHYDHVGGLVENGKKVFPKAKLIIAKDEMATVSDEAIAQLPEEYKKYFLPGNSAVKVYNRKVEGIVPGTVVAEGVTAVDLSGHSAGSMGYLFESEGRKLLMIGDTVIIAEMQFPHPESSLVYDSSSEKAALTRKTILSKAGAENIVVAAPHIPFPGIGTVQSEDPGFKFTPAQ